MGRAFYERYRVYRETIEEASEVLGVDVAQLCLGSENRKRLGRQEEAQLSVFATSVAMYRVLVSEIDLPISHFAGHSLGEYSALCCAGALEFAQGLELVRQRGEVIRHTADSLGGTMMWVLNLDSATVDAACLRAVATGLDVFVSAYDAPRQTAISGRTQHVLEVAAELEARGAIVYPLRLEGPYHSPLMRPAADRMASILARYGVTEPAAAVLANVDGEPHRGGPDSARRLADQLVSPIRWVDAQRWLVDEAVGLALEVGPGNVLSFLMEKTTRLVRPWAVDRYRSAEALRDDIVIGESDHLRLVEGGLRVAVSTPSRQGEPARYRQDVLTPYRDLEAIRKRARDGEPIGRAVTRTALDHVDGILRAKGLSDGERGRQFNRVLGGKVWRD
jgi:[acyl-carrier-protein] S-malonyltransferase